MNSSLHNHLIINSKGESILFQLNSCGEIKYFYLNKYYKIIHQPQLYQNNVLKYSVAIDKLDKIHLIALIKNGDLKYSIWDKDKWSHTLIARFNFQSYIYKNIKVLFENDKIHILYESANLINTNLYTIQHAIHNNHNWQRQNIIKFVSSNKSDSFMLDSDSFGLIHLLYNSTGKNIPHIYHTFYNPYTNKWNKVPNKLSSSNANKFYPYIFIDNKDNLHSLWIEEINKNYILKYSKLNTRGPQKYIWSQIDIPYISGFYNKPIMFEEKNILKIIYSNINSIGYIYSSDQGHTWNRGDVLDIELSNLSIIKICKSKSYSKLNKINHLYCSINKQLNFYFSDNFQVQNTSTHNPSNKIVNNFNQTIDKKKETVKSSVEIEQLLSPHKEIQDTLDRILNYQIRIDEKIESLTKTSENKKDSFFKKFIK